MESLKRGRLKKNTIDITLWVRTDGESLRTEGTTGYLDAAIADAHRHGVF